MRRKIDYAMVKQEFDARGYILLSKEYKNNASQLEYICPKHKDKGVLNITFASFTKGRGCPYCAHRARKTQKEYEEDVSRVKPNIKVIGKYVNLKTKIEHECRICGNRWMARPDNILYLDNGCPHCGKRELLNQEMLVQRVADIDEDIEVLGQYIDTQTKIAFKCKRCGREWMAKPNNILNGRGCPVCKTPYSKGEKRIEKILQSKNINFIREYSFEDCRDKAELPFDFYLPDKNLCIEYDGQQHYFAVPFGGCSEDQAKEAFYRTQKHDAIKNEYCKQKGIRLIRIPYYDFKNIENIISLI